MRCRENPDTPEGAHATGQNVAASALVPAPASPAIAAATESAASQGLLVSGLTLELDPERNGELRLGELRIPGGPDLTNVTANTSYRDRNLQLTDMNLAPEIHLRLLGIDGSKLEQQFLDVTLDADRLLGGNANITLNVPRPRQAARREARARHQRALRADAPAFPETRPAAVRQPRQIPRRFHRQHRPTQNVVGPHGNPRRWPRVRRHDDRTR